MCRWVNIIEMFEVSRGGSLGVFRSCHQTKPMVTRFSSMFSKRFTCLDEPSGEKKTKNICVMCSCTLNMEGVLLTGSCGVQVKKFLQ